MEPLGVGLLSCGVMGTSLARALTHLEGARMVAVCDVREEAAAPLAEELDVPYFLDAADLLKREEVQGVMVASPPFLHREMVEAAAAAGKHIFCEKPMAPTVADCEAMIAAVERAGVKLMIGQVCRFHPVHSKVKELAVSGQLGQPTCMVVYRTGGGWGGKWRTHWRQSRAQSGGTLMEVNSHELDFMRWVCGEVKQVYAQGGNYVSPYQDYPDIVLLMMTFQSGAVGLLHSSQATCFGGYGGRLDLTEGSIEFPAVWGENAGVRYRHKEEKEATFLALRDLPGENPVQHELRVWIEAVLQDTEPPVTGWDGRAAVEIAEAAYRSVETGEPVVLR
ncbi:MAG TPA: Gfo/Idh/MocA family oxidoreductase [Armatimonadetes bacterium]|nr:Gfo/Idh/MocA family oxidoreductase [Armatimonadota bacterium]